MISLLDSNSTAGKLFASNRPRKATLRVMNGGLRKVSHGHKEMTWSHLFPPPVVWVTVYLTFLEFAMFPSLWDYACQLCNEERKQGAKRKTR